MCSLSITRRRIMSWEAPDEDNPCWLTGTVRPLKLADKCTATSRIRLHGAGPMTPWNGCLRRSMRMAKVDGMSLTSFTCSSALIRRPPQCRGVR
jgi:hypothetical protein